MCGDVYSNYAETHLFLFRPPQNTIENWNNVFILGSGLYIAPAIVFMFFGSGEVQPWNEPDFGVVVVDKSEANNSSNNVEANVPVEKKKPTPTTAQSVTATEKTSITRL